MMIIVRAGVPHSVCGGCLPVTAPAAATAGTNGALYRLSSCTGTDASTNLTRTQTHRHRRGDAYEAWHPSVVLAKGLNGLCASLWTQNQFLAQALMHTISPHFLRHAD
jgi:hypothetical protein